jgi:hypothetical protein
MSEKEERAEGGGVNSTLFSQFVDFISERQRTYVGREENREPRIDEEEPDLEVTQWTSGTRSTPTGC